MVCRESRPTELLFRPRLPESCVEIVVEEQNSVHVVFGAREVSRVDGGNGKVR